MAYDLTRPIAPLVPPPKPKRKFVPFPARVPTNSGTVGAPAGGAPVNVNAGPTYTGGTSYGTSTTYAPGVSARGSAGTSMGLQIPSYRYRKTPGQLAAARFLQGLVQPSSAIPMFSRAELDSWRKPAKKSGGLFGLGTIMPVPAPSFGAIVGAVNPGKVVTAAGDAGAFAVGQMALGPLAVPVTTIGVLRGKPMTRDFGRFAMRQTIGTSKVTEMPQALVTQGLYSMATMPFGALAIPMRALGPGTTKVKELPNALVTNAKYSALTMPIGPAAPFFGRYHREGDPAHLTPFFKKVGSYGAAWSVLRYFGVPVPRSLTKFAQIFDITSAVGNAYMLSLSADRIAHGRGSWNRYLYDLLSFEMKMASLAMPGMKAAKLVGPNAAMQALRLRQAEVLLRDAGFYKSVLSLTVGGGAASILDDLKNGTKYVMRSPLTPVMPLIPHFARGGRVVGDQTALVGERGPEIVHLPDGANVVPAHRSRELMERASAGGSPFGGDRELHVIQQLDGREIARSTIRNLDDDEQWGWR